MPKDVENTPTSPPQPPRRGFGSLIDSHRPAVALGQVLEAGHAVAAHDHPRAQLIMNLTGTMRVLAGPDTWVVPPSHAVWIPGGLTHQVTTETKIEARNVYIDPAFAEGVRPEPGCTLLRVTPLLRELASRLADFGTSVPFGSHERRLAFVLIDEIAGLEPADLGLPGGQDARLVRVTGHLVRHPEAPEGLAELAAMAGTTERTLGRLFAAETGLGYRQWRGRLRMLVALEQLEAGKSSTEVAFTLGYGSASAFVAAFRRSLGAPPQAFRGAIRPAKGE